LKEKEVRQLSQLIKKELPNDYDKGNWKDEIDNTLSVEENRRIILEKIKPFKEQNLDNIKKADIKESNLRAEADRQTFLQNLERENEIEFIKSLDSIIKNKETDVLKKYYDKLRNFTQIVARKDGIYGMIVIGENGIGKSYNVIRALKENKIPFVFFNNFLTPLELYNILYQNSNDLILFDDTCNLLSNPISISILKSAMFSNSETRILHYETTSPKRTAPSSFIFKGAVIFLGNKPLDKGNEDLMALRDRVLFIELKMNYKEKIQIIFELAKQPYKELSEQERIMIANWIKDNCSIATKNLSLRLFHLFMEFYRYSKDKWQDYAKAILEEDERIAIIRKLEKQYSSVQEQIKEWINETGLSKRTFFRLKIMIN